MIVWGTRGDVVNLGHRATTACATCEKERPFDLVLQYRSAGFYWVFNFVTRKDYMLLCQACSRGWAVTQQSAERELKAVPIPFMRRYGLLSLVGAIVLFCVVAGGFGVVRARQLLKASPPPATGTTNGAG